MWLEDPNLGDPIKQWWETFELEGKASFVWWWKLKELKKKLKAMSKEVFGNIEVNIDERVERIELLDALEEDCVLDEHEPCEREFLRDGLKFLL
ncbi:hypothetical protein FRX31_012496 [Thalictrum thalictroides]|uniref:Uncharacterized protein n=1 Tax=Thalictrum thalictroides TaxID=46969 RepID=A0A7J6WLV5_THATH|nr:hypothetical protein FRX31_012496 [Thalictrum thalictroides]